MLSNGAKFFFFSVFISGGIKTEPQDDNDAVI